MEHSIEKTSLLFNSLVVDDIRGIILAFCFIVVTYVVLRPIVHWLVKGRHLIFLTYWIVSLLIIAFIALLQVRMEKWNLLMYILEALSLFGFTLALIYGVRYLKDKFFQRYRRRSHKI